MTTDNLLPKVKSNLILEHDADDGLLLHYIKAAVNDSIVALLGELLKIGHDVVIERNE